MRKCAGLILFALSWLTVPVLACDIDCNDDFSADSCLGPASAITAVGRLGPVRTVVYDPVSNSFAFIIPCSEALSQGGISKEDIRNRQYLDSHRLALTTQKIRLLILPYNPVDGGLTLQDSRTQGGIEFAEAPVASVPKSQDTKQTAASKPGKAKKPKVPSLVADKDLANMLGKAKSMLNKRSPASLSASLKNSSELTADLDKSIGDWNLALERVNGDMLHLQFDSNCVHMHIQEAPIQISRQSFPEWKRSSPWPKMSLCRPLFKRLGGELIL